MNKLISIACASVILSSSAFGAQYNGTNYASTNAVGAPAFVTSSFNFTSSSDVITFTDETARVFAVGTAHPKGNTLLGFGSNTEGGLITDCTVSYTAPVAETREVPDGLGGTGTVTENQGC
jgi:hypothetical protein